MIIAEKCPNFKWRQITSLLLDMKSVKVLEGTFYKYPNISDCPFSHYVQQVILLFQIYSFSSKHLATIISDSVLSVVHSTRLYSRHWHQTLSNTACMSAWGTIQEIIAAVSGKNSELLQLWLWLWTHHKLGVNRRVESTRWLIKDNKYPSNWNSHFVNQNH